MADAAAGAKKGAAADAKKDKTKAKAKKEKGALPEGIKVDAASLPAGSVVRFARDANGKQLLDREGRPIPVEVFIPQQPRRPLAELPSFDDAIEDIRGYRVVSAVPIRKLYHILRLANKPEHLAGVRKALDIFAVHKMPAPPAACVELVAALERMRDAKTANMMLMSPATFNLQPAEPAYRRLCTAAAALGDAESLTHAIKALFVHIKAISPATVETVLVAQSKVGAPAEAMVSFVEAAVAKNGAKLSPYSVELLVRSCSDSDLQKVLALSAAAGVPADHKLVKLGLEKRANKAAAAAAARGAAATTDSAASSAQAKQ